MILQSAKPGGLMITRFFIAFALIISSGLASGASAKPALVFDMTNDLVLYAEDQDRPWHPASLTKIMTAYLVFEAIKKGKLGLEDDIVCSKEANHQAPSKMGLPVGGKIQVKDAVRALIIKSANDVAVMLAEKVAGSHEAFARKMTETARRLGMKHTRFVNANGLPDARQVTTARDMGLLARAILRDFPEYKEVYAMQEAKVGKRILRSHNGLLRTFEGADGIKTGFICASGYNVVASATRDGRQLVAVVLGATTSGARTIRAKTLLEYGFESSEWKELFKTPKIDQLPAEEIAVGPPNLRGTLRVCGGRPTQPPKIQKKTKLEKKASATAPASLNPSIF